MKYISFVLLEPSESRIKLEEANIGISSGLALEFKEFYEGLRGFTNSPAAVLTDVYIRNIDGKAYSFRFATLDEDELSKFQELVARANSEHAYRMSGDFISGDRVIRPISKPGNLMNGYVKEDEVMSNFATKAAARVAHGLVSGAKVVGKAVDSFAERTSFDGVSIKDRLSGKSDKEDLK